MKVNKKFRIIIAVFFLLCAFIALLLSPLFDFTSINVNGSGFYSSEEIQNSLEHLKDKNYFITLFKNTPFSHLDYIFKGRLYDIEQQLLFDKPYIKNVEISFSFPGVAEVEIQERSPSFLAKNDDEYLLIDSEGYVLQAFSAEEKPGYPVVEGVDASDFKVGNTLVGRGTDSQLVLAIKICNGLSQIQLSEGAVDIVDVSDPDHVWMFVRPSLSICFGDEENLSVKLSALKEILASGYDGNSNGVIDFTNGKNPIFKKNTDSEAPITEENVTGGTESYSNGEIPIVDITDDNIIES